MKLIGMPVSDTYQAAAERLEGLGYRPDGLPMGHTWRSAAKLSDAELIAGTKLPGYVDGDEGVDWY